MIPNLPLRTTPHITQNPIVPLTQHTMLSQTTTHLIGQAATIMLVTGRGRITMPPTHLLIIMPVISLLPTTVLTMQNRHRIIMLLTLPALSTARTMQ
jgi:hypothetical protein